MKSLGCAEGCSQAVCSWIGYCCQYDSGIYMCLHSICPVELIVLALVLYERADGTSNMGYAKHESDHWG